MDYSKLTHYIPLLTTVLAAYLTYFFGYRKGKLNKFFNEVEENINDILSPMFHDIRQINRLEIPFKREELLKKFFCKYGSNSTNLHKIGERYILELYYSTEDLFYNFTKIRSNENWTKFYTKFYELYNQVKKEYDINHDIIYCNYTWHKCLNEKNYLLRLISEIGVFLYETLKFIVSAGFLLLVPMIVEYNTGKWAITIEFIQAYLILLFIFSGIFGALMMFSSDYNRLKTMQKRKSDLRKFLERNFPKIFVSNNDDYNDINKSIEIPKMYEKYIE